jgi:hypothetical protein
MNLIHEKKLTRIQPQRTGKRSSIFRRGIELISNVHGEIVPMK